MSNSLLKHSLLWLWFLQLPFWWQNDGPVEGWLLPLPCLQHRNFRSKIPRLSSINLRTLASYPYDSALCIECQNQCRRVPLSKALHRGCRSGRFPAWSRSIVDSYSQKLGVWLYAISARVFIGADDKPTAWREIVVLSVDSDEAMAPIAWAQSPRTKYRLPIVIVVLG